MKRFIGVVLLGAAFAVLPLARAAEEPSLQEVNAAVRSGHLAEAQSMMQTVLRDHPNSAKAHFVDAEVLVRMARTEEARGELARAEQLEPGLPSIRPETVEALRARLAGGEPAVHVAQPSQALAPSFPWGPLFILLGIGAVIVLILRARRAAQPQVIVQGGPQPYGMGTPYGSPYGAPMGGGGMGSGILGGLATGAAVGAGMVAGEALAGELMGHHEHPQASNWGDDSARLAGNDTSDLGVDGNWDSGGGGDFSGGIGGDDWG